MLAPSLVPRAAAHWEPGYKASFCPHNVLHFWFSPEHTHTHTQFVVYSGYYYVLTLIFIGAGVYKLTSTGWLKSLHICCHEIIPHSSGEQALIQNEDSIEENEYNIELEESDSEPEESDSKPV